MTASGALRGRLVCLEGIDGAGKSTAAAAATALLRERGVPAVVVDRDYRFPSSYVDRHLAGLRHLIWGHPPADPYLALGDLHWVHLQAAWYLAVGRCAVQPLLRRGTVVLTDTWTHKFVAKLALRPGVDMSHVRTLFADVLTPDLVIRLDIDPAVAAARKPVISASEAGNHEGVVERSKAAFTLYQSRLGRVLDAMGEQAGWPSLEVTGMTVSQVAAAVADIVFGWFPDCRPAPAGPASRSSS